MTSVGVQIDQFDAPVCNSFQAKLFNDQLCYEVDLNKYRSKKNIENELKLGFAFIMDYNEDRQVIFDLYGTHGKVKDKSLVESIVESSDNSQKAVIYLNTIGKH